MSASHNQPKKQKKKYQQNLKKAVDNQCATILKHNNFQYYCKFKDKDS